jgi:radical SAM superfamily enzyme with C-terminal helix-hairpin-helix motif
LNISNTETEKFTQEVTVLRKYGILENFRTSEQAKNIAFKTKKNKKDVPRYKVKLP